MIEWIDEDLSMKPTMADERDTRKKATPQVVELKPPVRINRVLSQTALEIAYRWLFRRQAQLYLATKYGLPRPVIEQIILDVLNGEHGPFVAPSSRLERMAA
jgi:hypothetical protein